MKKKKDGPMPLQNRKLFFLAAIAATLFFPFFAHAFLYPIEFNQFLIQQLELRYGIISYEMLTDFLSSAYSAGLLTVLFQPIRDQPPFEEKEKMFAYVFSWIPSYAITYPTEGFYYFSFPNSNPKIMGNIRIADLDEGKISFAYFVTTNPQEQTRILDVNESNGLRIEKKSDYLYDVSFNGKTVRFKIPKTDFLPPQKTELLPTEEFVGHIHDESGIKLFLLYNHDTNSFYEILDDEGGTPEQFDDLNDGYVLGKRTAFVFFKENNPKRAILTGVFLENIKANNYFDGPGDQVPFRAWLKEKLRVAYPNTFLGDGIDEHGVYLNRPAWTRIAISPYERYSKIEDVVLRRKNCDASTASKSFFWTCLTKEWWNTKNWREGIFEQLKKEGKILKDQNAS